ncbi:hypothetical protein KFE98_04125 [bacterium SCSIO 12741]|nr:hypothetical protein KFE98_04125 [bacterium SCSIO 12741]
MNRSIQTIIGLAVLVLMANHTASAQSPYGYKGKKLFLNYDLSGSLSILRMTESGENAFPALNLFHNVSLSMVTNKTTALGLNYKYYSDVASVTDGANIGPFSSGPLSSSDFLAHERFTTNEIGVHITWYTSDLNAPLGRYVSMGLGLGMSNFPETFRVSTYQEDYLKGLNETSSGVPNPDDVFIFYDNARPIISPIFRTTLGGQQLFFDRFFLNAAMEFGLNLGIIGAALSSNGDPIEPILVGSGNIDQETLNQNTRAAVQQRVFMKNLLNFKIGGGILLF